MTATVAMAQALCLSRLVPSRLGPSALQSRLDEVEGTQMLMPCGGLTRRQIEGASLPRLADLAARLRRRLGLHATGRPHDG